mgnify:CR=1 FL=1
MLAAEDSDVLNKINTNLAVIRKILEIQARDSITKKLNKLASTPERRKMWILSNGNLSTEQIAKRAGVKTDRSVQYFTKDAVKAGLLDFKKRGYPIRLVDFIPADWEESESLDKDALSTGESASPELLPPTANTSLTTQSPSTSSLQAAETHESA